MELVANYEIRSEYSVFADDFALRIQHPRGLYRVKIQNIQRTAFTSPFLLSLHLYFSAASLDESKEVADEAMFECLNTLSFVTGGTFKLHRIRQIVAIPPESGGLRSLLMWGDAIEYEDPEPVLDEAITRTIVRLLAAELPSAVRRAVRWYRLGVNELLPDDQFMSFWFALEIVAEYRKSVEKVPSKCPHCQSPLFCETCEKHPVHRPYAKQAIRELLGSVDKDFNDGIFERLDRTRNSLMHGQTLKEIEGSLPEPHEEIVDVLGRLLWKALLAQFPRELLDDSLHFGFPTTYVHRSLNAIAHIQTVVPIGEDGDLLLGFKGTTMQMTTFGPPQSAQPTIISMSVEQYSRLRTVQVPAGNSYETVRRMRERCRQRGDRVGMLVLSTDMTLLKEIAGGSEVGTWPDLVRELLTDLANGERGAMPSGAPSAS